uniref:C2H2-type domain-containing protein n=1 Tax=Aquila chrysaetos chrysaetos TaxID=223781 RepID=A0A663FGV5_AQUCH
MEGTRLKFTRRWGEGQGSDCVKRQIHEIACRVKSVSPMSDGLGGNYCCSAVSFRAYSRVVSKWKERRSYDEASSGNDDDPLADDPENVKQYETLLEAFEGNAFQRSEMHPRDRPGERQDDGIQLEKALEGLHGILLHPGGAIGDNHSGYSDGEEIVSQTSNFQERKASQTEKSHKCPKCNKGFRWFSDLIKHQRSHPGEKPFICSECGENFKVSSHFISQRRMHTGERPYPSWPLERWKDPTVLLKRQKQQSRLRQWEPTFGK